MERRGHPERAGSDERQRAHTGSANTKSTSNTGAPASGQEGGFALGQMTGWDATSDAREAAATVKKDYLAAHDA